MTENEFITYIKNAAATAAQLMDAEQGVFQVTKVPTGTNGGGCFSVGNNTFQLALRQDVSPNYLLNTFIDITVDRIRSNSFLVEAASKGLFVASVDGPCSPEQWGEDLYRDMQNRLIQTFSVGLCLKFALIDSLSAQRYEGDKCRGGLVFESDEKANIDSLLCMSVKSASEISFEKDMLRQIRKLLAGAGGNFLVFRREGQKYICKGYCCEANSVKFKWGVRFADVLDWRFYHYKDALFRFSRNDPKVIRDPIEQVLESLQIEFGSSFKSKYACPLLQKGLEQSHGTALIFVDFGNHFTKDWINRLYANRHAFQLISCQSTEDAVRCLSGMDGALLIDVRTMEVRYFTAIVDGHVNVAGNLSRGARHNSIHTFVSDLVLSSPNSAPKIAAVVFSEDGGAVTICGKDFHKFRHQSTNNFSLLSKK